MVPRRAGRIINVSSYAAIRPAPYMSPYGSAKAAVLHLTNSLAAEAKDYGISVFAVTPGTVQTDLTKDIMQESARHDLPHELVSKRWIPPERVGELAVFLSSGKATASPGGSFTCSTRCRTSSNARMRSNRTTSTSCGSEPDRGAAEVHPFGEWSADTPRHRLAHVELHAVSDSSSDAVRGRIADLVRERQELREEKASAFLLEQNRLAIVQAQLELARTLVSEHAAAFA